MDFSLNVDPSLASFIPSPSSLEYFTRHDFDLSADLPFLPVPVPEPRTIEPSQLTDMSDTSSPSSSVSSPNTSYRSSSESSSPEPRSKKSKSHHDDDHAKRHQTKLACTWCRKLSKKCDTQRPCGRCKQFNRCAECVDAPPRKPRAKGVDRGTYKKTRDLAVHNYEEAVNRRQTYVAKMEKQGRHLDVGLTADQILEATRKEEARNKENMEDMVVIPQPVMGNILQGGSPAPFTGPLEDLFTCSASPEDLLLPLPSPPLSPDAESLFEVSSPTESVTDYDESDHAAWDWFPMHQFPTIMKLVGAAETEQDKPVDMEELRRWSESIMA